MTTRGRFKAEIVAEDGSVLRVPVNVRDNRTRELSDIERRGLARRARSEAREALRAEDRTILDTLGLVVR